VLLTADSGSALFPQARLTQLGQSGHVGYADLPGPVSTSVQPDRAYEAMLERVRVGTEQTTAATLCWKKLVRTLWKRSDFQILGNFELPRPMRLPGEL
jgi:hypothetical protein